MQLIITAAKIDNINQQAHETQIHSKDNTIDQVYFYKALGGVTIIAFFTGGVIMYVVSGLSEEDRLLIDMAELYIPKNPFATSEMRENLKQNNLKNKKKIEDFVKKYKLEEYVKIFGIYQISLIQPLSDDTIQQYVNDMKKQYDIYTEIKKDTKLLKIIQNNMNALPSSPINLLNLDTTNTYSTYITKKNAYIKHITDISNLYEEIIKHKPLLIKEYQEKTSNIDLPFDKMVSQTRVLRSKDEIITAMENEINTKKSPQQ